MSVLDGWTLGEHEASGVIHPTYRKGSGPGVVVIHEIPGITADVIGFAEDVVAAGFTVVMPHLFGTPGAGVNPRSIGSLRQVCVSSEFTKLATGRDRPDRRPGCAAWPASSTPSSADLVSAPSACASPAVSRWP